MNNDNQIVQEYKGYAQLYTFNMDLDVWTASCLMCDQEFETPTSKLRIIMHIKEHLKSDHPVKYQEVYLEGM